MFMLSWFLMKLWWDLMKWMRLIIVKVVMILYEIWWTWMMLIIVVAMIFIWNMIKMNEVNYCWGCYDLYEIWWTWMRYDDMMNCLMLLWFYMIFPTIPILPIFFKQSMGNTLVSISIHFSLFVYTSH